MAIVVARHDEVLQVPTASIIDLGEGPVLNVIREGKAVPLHPEPGLAHDGWTAVAGTDLKPGELVIVEGGYNLPEGTPVKLAEEKEEAKDGEHADEGDKAKPKDEEKPQAHEEAAR